MKAFITGITGFAGSHLAEHLLRCGDRVIGSMLNPKHGLDAAGLSMPGVDLLTWDLRGEASTHLRKRLTEFAPDCIYHLAGLSVPHYCGKQEPTELAWQVNVEGTRRVLELAESLPGRPRVLVVSSSYVYGKVEAGATRRTEASMLSPQRGYGKSKLAAEQLAREATEAGKLDCVIARPFNHTGPRQTPEMMLPEWAQQFTIDGTMPIAVHTLNAWLDLTDVRDVVRAYRLLLEHGTPGDAYNVGSGIMRRSGDVFERLRELADDRRSYEETLPGERYGAIADTAKLLAATHWQPEISLWRTIEETWQYWVQRSLRA